ncbi:hypothetical protein AXXA_30617 [Achromobacter insuavis AXX-A]|uniref:Uncharacterized protein n=1 Tax=Achromobacter insuavis AXX-A TaxID=1003200 RepID=F7TAX1_9BURK|nr:hypothetical protein AXXA_30617 [Achromobacter insuavis AXX-A]
MPSFGCVEPAAGRGATGCKFGFDLGNWHQAAGVGGIQASQHLTSEPDAMPNRILLLMSGLAQMSRMGAVSGPLDGSELVVQDFMDTKDRITHCIAPVRALT